jgi:1,4-dihydroxy-2-naphthoate octaprenyltransferase
MARSKKRQSIYHRIEAYLDVARTNFLALPVALVFLGVAAAVRDGYFDMVRSGLMLFGLISLHVAVNVINEYSDYRRGIDEETEKTPFSGGSGALPEGELEPPSALRLGVVAVAVGTVIFAYLVYHVGFALVPIVVVGVAIVIGYTDVLARIGLGEMAAGLGLGFLPVIATALVQEGTIGATAYAAGIPAFLLTFNLLLLNEFPDEVPDRRGGRTNLIHLLGRPTAARLYVLAGAAVPIMIVGFVATGVFAPLALVGVVPSVFLYRPTSWAVSYPADDVPVEALRDNVIWVLFTVFLLAGGLIFPAEALATAAQMSVNEGLFLIGRSLFGIVLAFMAFNNFVDLNNVASRIGEAGVPYPKAATIAASVPLMFSAVSIALGIYPVVGASYLVVFLVVTTVVVHNFLGIDDPDEQDNEIFHFLKNLLILAAALMFLALGIGGSIWPYGLGVSFFS